LVLHRQNSEATSHRSCCIKLLLLIRDRYRVQLDAVLLLTLLEI
jgi:hypothetical protein